MIITGRHSRRKGVGGRWFCREIKGNIMQRRNKGGGKGAPRRKEGFTKIILVEGGAKGREYKGPQKNIRKMCIFS